MAKNIFFFMTLEEENEKLVCFGFTRNLCQSSLFTVSDEILEFLFQCYQAILKHFENQ